MRTTLAFAVLLSAATAAATPRPPSADGARALFERLKGLEGTWTSRSTRGWEASLVVSVIAGGSAVLMTSRHAHPGETMLTVYVLDGDRVLLTHYCVAGNQPRLRASEHDAGGGTARFVYVDGTGLPNRDTGHMDQLLMTFAGPDRFTSRWTWYARGAERWLEEIEHTRTR